jgi:hypothetical protein
MGESTHEWLDSVVPQGLALHPVDGTPPPATSERSLRFVGDTYAAPAGSFRLDTIARRPRAEPSDDDRLGRDARRPARSRGCG